MPNASQPESAPLAGCGCLIILMAIVLTITGSVYFATGNAFERSVHTGIIIKRYVSLRDTTTRASQAMLHGVSTSWQAGDTEAYVSGSSHQSKFTEYYVNALISYSSTNKHGATFYKNCSMTVACYGDDGYSAAASLAKVPLGKQKEVHVSKHHHSKYCIDKHGFNYYQNTGLGLMLTGCGLFVLSVCVCLCSCAEKRGTREPAANGIHYTHVSSCTEETNADSSDSAERGQATSAHYDPAHGKAHFKGSSRPHVPTSAENAEIEMAQMLVLASTPTESATRATGVHSAAVTDANQM
jgi:hypothetical protein